MKSQAKAFALPADDAPLEALDTQVRERIGREWLRRAEVELSAATLSAQIARGLLLDGSVDAVLDLAVQAVSDEIRHARICHAVAERYLDRPLCAPRSRPIDEPAFGDCPPPLSRLLGLVLHSCINETFATVCLREGMRLATGVTARAATKQLLRDDLNHARIGWAHLASSHVDVDAKREIGQALPTLLRLGRDGWLHELRADFDDPNHAVLGQSRFPALMKTALTELVLPGFDLVGVDTHAARQWAAR
jgi:hypothetical protein